MQRVGRRNHIVTKRIDYLKNNTASNIWMSFLSGCKVSEIESDFSIAQEGVYP